MSFASGDTLVAPQASGTNSGYFPTLLGRPSTAPSEQSLPVLLGRRPGGNATQTLPAQLSRTATGRDQDLTLRRRERARFGTIRSLALHGDLPDFLAAPLAPVPSILRPPRVVLSTADGVQSMCLLRDREIRLQFVRAGLPGGPLLREEEGCAICLEPFKTGDRVQLMANCRHVFHAGCIDGFLRAHFPECLDSDCVSCPLCRGPLLASTVSQVPHRERSLVTNLGAEWFESSTTNSFGDDATTPSDRDVVALKPADESKIATQACKLPLRRAGTAPLDETGSKRPAVCKRSATAPLDALE